MIRVGRARRAVRRLATRTAEPTRHARTLVDVSASHTAVIRLKAAVATANRRRVVSHEIRATCIGRITAAVVRCALVHIRRALQLVAARRPACVARACVRSGSLCRPRHIDTGSVAAQLAVSTCRGGTVVVLRRTVHTVVVGRACAYVNA